MSISSNFRLLSYQANQSRSSTPTVPVQAAGVPSSATPMTNASVSASLSVIQQQLALVQQQAETLIDTYVPSQTPIAPAPAPMPPALPASPNSGPSVATLNSELSALQKQANALMKQLQGMAQKVTKPTPTPAPTSQGAYGEPWSPSSGQLHGADTSNWQSSSAFDKSIAGTQWTAIKASQGTGYTDPSFQARWNALGQKIKDGQMKLRMAYCFLDPGNGAAQAKHFLDVVGVHGKLPAGTRLALDWEGPALGSPQTLKDAADYIHQVTGLWPVIYVQGSKMSVAQQEVPNAPIWEAAWGGSINKNVPFFQYSDGGSSGIDQDVFNGSQQALAKFAGWSA